MVPLNDLNSLDIDTLFKELGLSDYLFIQTSNYLDELQVYREHLLIEIQKKYGQINNKDLDPGSGSTTRG